MLGAADLTCFHGTPHNLDVLRRVHALEKLDGDLCPGQTSCARDVEEGVPEYGAGGRKSVWMLVDG